jgi:hypothetical protein
MTLGILVPHVATTHQSTCNALQFTFTLYSGRRGSVQLHSVNVTTCNHEKQRMANERTMEHSKVSFVIGLLINISYYKYFL